MSAMAIYHQSAAAPASANVLNVTISGEKSLAMMV
jgi:hypothetical protein